MNILNNKGSQCDPKFIKTIGAVNIDCLNKFIKEYSTLVISSDYVSLITEDIINLSDERRINERLCTIGLYSDMYNKAFKNCLEFSRILSDNGTLDKINNYDCFYIDENSECNKFYNIVLYNEFNLIKDYFSDYHKFMADKNYNISGFDELNERYDLINAQYDFICSNLNTNFADNNCIKKIKRR